MRYTNPQHPQQCSTALEEELINYFIIIRGEVAVIEPGIKHAIKAVDKELHIIEVQIGDELTEDDIERLDWDW